jgi:hypothetical protein
MLPDASQAYDFYGIRVAFAPLWEKPSRACPGVPLTATTIGEIQADHARALAGQGDVEVVPVKAPPATQPMPAPTPAMEPIVPVKAPPAAKSMPAPKPVPPKACPTPQPQASPQSGAGALAGVVAAVVEPAPKPVLVKARPKPQPQASPQSGAGASAGVVAARPGHATPPPAHIPRGAPPSPGDHRRANRIAVTTAAAEDPAALVAAGRIADQVAHDAALAVALSNALNEGGPTPAEAAVARPKSALRSSRSLGPAPGRAIQGGMGRSRSRARWGDQVGRPLAEYHYLPESQLPFKADVQPDVQPEDQPDVESDGETTVFSESDGETPPRAESPVQRPVVFDNDQLRHFLHFGGWRNSVAVPAGASAGIPPPGGPPAPLPGWASAGVPLVGVPQGGPLSPEEANEPEPEELPREPELARAAAASGSSRRTFSAEPGKQQVQMPVLLQAFAKTANPPRSGSEERPPPSDTQVQPPAYADVRSRLVLQVRGPADTARLARLPSGWPADMTDRHLPFGRLSDAPVLESRPAVPEMVQGRVAPPPPPPPPPPGPPPPITDDGGNSLESVEAKIQRELAESEVAWREHQALPPFPPLMLIRAAANCALPHLRLCAPSNDCFFPGMSHLLSELTIVITLVETNIALRSAQVAGRQQLNYRKMCKVQFPVPPLLNYSSSLLFT